MIRMMIDVTSGLLHGFDDRAFKDAALEETYSKSEINRLLTSVLHWKGTLETVDQLPTEGNKVGDVWAVTSDGVEYAWKETNEWEALGPLLDLTDYYTKEEVDELLSGATPVPGGTTVKCTVVTSESDKPTDNNSGDVCIVATTVAGTEHIKRLGYIWDGTQWQQLSDVYEADKVVLTENIQLAGDYTAVGNIKMEDGVLNCKGWTVAKMFSEIFNKTIAPVLGSAPSVSVSLTSAGSKEVGSSFTPEWSLSFNQGKYNQPWDGKTQNDGTTVASWHCRDSNGNTATTNKGSYPKFTVTDNYTYRVYAYADYNAGTYGTSNTGSTTDVRRGAGTTEEKGSSQVTAFRHMYIGSVANTDAITESLIKGLSKKYTTGARTLTLKTGGTGTNVVPLVAGAKRVIVAIPVRTGANKSACGGYTVSSVLLASASNTPITSDYKLSSTNVEVSGAVDDANKKDYQIWVYQPASIDAGEVHTITIA